MGDYGGDERRQKQNDHDLLVEMHMMLKGMKENYDKHVSDDDKHFVRLYSGQNKLRWYIGIGIGILTAVQFLIARAGVR